MAGGDGPGNARKPGRRQDGAPAEAQDDLDRRRRSLEASLAAKGPGTDRGTDPRGAGPAGGYGQALRLSSEFIAGVAVGAGLGWVIDRLAGTSPFGLIVFLLLGFGAGVLNVMRAAGKVAEAGIRTAPDGRDTGRDRR